MILCAPWNQQSWKTDPTLIFLHRSKESKTWTWDIHRNMWIEKLLSYYLLKHTASAFFLNCWKNTKETQKGLMLYINFLDILIFDIIRYLTIVWPLLSRWIMLLLGRLVVFCSKYQHQNQLRYAFWCILLSLLPFLASQATTRILWFICMKCEDRQSIT